MSNNNNNNNRNNVPQNSLVRAHDTALVALINKHGTKLKNVKSYWEPKYDLDGNPVGTPAAFAEITFVDDSVLIVQLVEADPNRVLVELENVNVSAHERELQILVNNWGRGLESIDHVWAAMTDAFDDLVGPPLPSVSVRFASAESVYEQLQNAQAEIGQRRHGGN